MFDKCLIKCLYVPTFFQIVPVIVHEFFGNDHGPRGRNGRRLGGAGSGGQRKKARGTEKKMPSTHVKRCVSMAVRLPNGRSPRQPLRTLCSLPFRRSFRLSLSIRLSIPLPGHPTRCTLRTPVVDPHHRSTNSLPRRKGAALASKSRIISTP